MNTDEALKLALEALRSAAAELYTASSYCNTYEVLGNTNDAITAIQQARAAQPAPVQSCYCPNCEAMGKELAALKAHLTEEKKVELATNWFAEDWAITKAVGMLHDYDRLLRKTTPPAPAQPAPVCIGWDDKTDTPVMGYTTPPAAQRQWVGLTNEEREAIISNSMTPACVLIATEAKLKEKNT
jgi:hypothetical protein